MQLSIVLDRNKPEPLQEQLVQQLRFLIQQGSLNDGHQLPSTRTFAESLGVARVTVCEAYAKLKAQGFIEFKRNARPVVLGTAGECSERILAPARTASVPTQLSSYGRRLADMEIVRFTRCEPVPEAVQTAVRQWQVIARQACDRANWVAEAAAVEDLGYRPLRAAIADFMVRNRGINCSANNVALFASAEQALFLISAMFVDAGDVVGLDPEAFAAARQYFTARGAQVTPISAFEETSYTPRLAYISSHYPERKRLYKWAFAEDALIIEHEVDFDFDHQSKRAAASAAMDRQERVIYLADFEKPLYPVCRLGFAVIPHSLVDVFHRAKLMSERGFSLFENVVLARLIASM